MRPSIEAAWGSSAAAVSSAATRAYGGLADPANWPAVLFFLAALIVLRLSLRLVGGRSGSVFFLPRRLVTLLLIPALACTIAHGPYLDAAQVTPTLALTLTLTLTPTLTLTLPLTLTLTRR